MGSHERKGHPGEGRIKKLIDELAEILRGLPPDRQEAFREYLDAQIKQEEGEHDGRDPAETD